MKLALSIGAAVVAAGLVTGSARIAWAQADRTLGVNCTEAGHIHCGENGPIFGSRLYGWYGWHRWHRHHYRHHYYSSRY